MAERWILDFRAGTPWTDASRATQLTAMSSAWADPGHPSSEGRRSASWMDAARATVREATGFPYVAFAADRDQAVLDVMRHWDGQFAAVGTHRLALLAHIDQVLAVDEDGARQDAVPQGMNLLLQAANDETGVIDASAPTRKLLDATTAFARVPLDSDAEAVVLDARAWGSPTPTAIILSRRTLGLPDSVSVPAAVVAVDQLTRVLPGMPARTAAEADSMDAFEARVRRELPDVQFHGSQRVPHIRSLSILHLDAEALMRELDARGFVVGSGSACVLDGRPSHVLAAMGRVTHGNLRLAIPWDLPLEVLDRFATILVQTARELRVAAGVEDL